MSFYEVYKSYEHFDFDRFFNRVTDNDVLRVLVKENLNDTDSLTLLSPQAARHLATTAATAQELTIRHFGKVIYLYAPLYLANFCINSCVYCGFNHANPITRKKLSFEEVEREARIISAYGIRHILILTGESPKETSVSYIADCVRILKQYFTSISIEIYPLDKEQYKQLIETGVDGLTIYQETYDEAHYDELHPKGPKRDYRFRLDTPERACEAGMRSIGAGALLGLSDWKKDAFFSGLHAFYLQNKYLSAEISLSLPRMQPHAGGFMPKHEVTDREFVQILLAYRLFMPRAGITVSTRERNEFRKNLIGLGITRISAGSRTEVGGYSLSGKSEGQFETADKSSVEDIKSMITAKGYQPVMKDWQTL